MRTHEAGMIRSEHAGTEVTVAGWVAARRDHGGVVFFDLRDASGVVQVVVDPGQIASSGASGVAPGPDHASGGAIGPDDVHHIGREWVLQIMGTVRPRPAGTVNADLPTGAVEVAGMRMSAAAMGTGSQVRCRNSQPPRRATTGARVTEFRLYDAFLTAFRRLI